MHPLRRSIPLLFAALAAASSVLAQPAGGSLPRLRVEGNRFVDPSGETVVLRGLSFSDPDKLERDGQWGAAYFDAARSWGANVVRFPVHPSAWRARGEEGYLRLLDEGVAMAAERGMYVIIDWHSIGNLRTELYQHPMYYTTRAETFGFWRTVAARYAGNPAVAFYELFNEPTSYRGTLGRLSWSEHRELMEDLIAVVRANAPEAIPLVAGLDWGYDLSGVREDPIRAEGIAYVAHPYPQKRAAPWEAVWDETWGFVAAAYPLMATELGFMSADGPGAHVPVIADEAYGRAVVDYFEARGISWTPWVFDPQWAPQLIEDWTFAPTAQGRFFRERIRTLNGHGAE
jgi:endoglucanase